jgi:hypothetical protein
MSVLGASLAGVPPVRAQDETTWLLDQINGLRAGLGLYPYTLNAQLTAAATRQSQFMAETCNVSHTWPDGTTPTDRAQQAGYTGNWISENIYAGSNARPIDAWTFWVNSPVHYSGLVHDVVNEVGIGIVHGGVCGHAYTLLFGHRDDVNAPPAPAVSSSLGDSAESGPAAPPVYVPPPPTHTPTPTIPTLTPSATWTITRTRTPTRTGAPPTATGTPLVLPTVPALGQGGDAASETPDEPVPTPAPTDSPQPAVMPASSAEGGEAVAEAASPIPPTMTPGETTLAPSVSPGERAPGGDGGVEPRDLVPVALAIQIAVIGAVGFWYFRRTR